MKSFFSICLMVLAGFLIQMLLVFFLPSPYFCPHVILLVTVACGLSRGSAWGESVGFGGGLALDAMGLTAFGAQGLVLSVSGYLSGFVSRWVNIDEPVSQMIMGGFGSILYFLGLHLLDRFLGGIGRAISPGLVLSSSITNIVVAPLVFLGVRLWLHSFGFESAPRD